MPVGQFPGPRNWGYDGAYPYAAQTTYGGPEGLKRLVDACHQRGLAVVLDVVYNHFGPEGTYLADFGPYFSERYHTLWGASLNFDGPHSDPVREYFIQNMLYWIVECHVDALRLDAVHAMLDFSAGAFLEELAGVVDAQRTALRRLIYLLAESDLNDARIVRPRELGGYDLDAQWSDDFHHSLHTLLTGEQDGYYADFVGDEGEAHVATLARAMRDGFVYSGQYSRVRRRRHGNSALSVPGHRFIVSLQNHDQVGNRAAGDRLSANLSFERLKLGAGALLLAPYVPLIFMGEEYGETAPFQYFVSHSDPDLIEAVRAGRRNEFGAFAWQEDVPDPQDESTFMRSKLNLDLRTNGHHRLLWFFYQELLRLRHDLPALAHLDREQTIVQPFEREKVLYLQRGSGDDAVWAAFNFARERQSTNLPVPDGSWRKLLDSADQRWELGREERRALEMTQPSLLRTLLSTVKRESPVPPQVAAREGLALSLQPEAFVLFAREASS
jgi:maltooligosyltrehalose trehalohydrolase